MKKFAKLVKDTATGFLFLNLMIGMVLCLQIIYEGRFLCLSFGIFKAFIILITSSFAAYIVSSSMMSLAVRNRAGTMELTEMFFGRYGSLFCALLMSLTCGIWFTNQLDFSLHFFNNLQNNHLDFIKNTFTEDSLKIYFLITASLIVATRHGLLISGAILVPAAFFVSFLAIVFFPSQLSISIVESKMTCYKDAADLFSTSSLLLALSTGIFATPILYKFAKTQSAAAANLKIVYLLLYPLFCGIGIMFGYFSPKCDLISLCSHLETKWPIIIYMYILLSTCTINILNLYFGANALNYLFNFKYRSTAALLMFLISLMLILFAKLLASLDFLCTVIAVVMIIIIVKNSLKLLGTSIYEPKANFHNFISLVLSISILPFFYFKRVAIVGDFFWDAVIFTTILCFCTTFIIHKQTFN